MDVEQGQTARATGSADNLYWFMMAAAAAQPDKDAIVEAGPDGRTSAISFGKLNDLIGVLPAGLGTARFGEGGLTADLASEPRRRQRREVLPTDPAYMIFTSGSTGEPKGVVMSHRAVIAFYRGVLSQDVVWPTDRLAVTSALQFDFSLAGIGTALGAGATVVLMPPDRIGWPKRFVDFMTGHGVTQIHGVPSIWRNLLKDDPGRLAELDRLRLILFAGEEFPLHELRLLQQALPRVSLMNAYGATETMACSVTAVPSPLPTETTKLSIGFAHPGAEMMLIGEDGQPVEIPGEVGEIYVRSPAMFTGYWAEPEATRAVQVPDPLNPRSGELVFRSGDLGYHGSQGEMYFCGRVDSQVKIRGNRVELGGVERAVSDFPGTTQAVVMLLPRADGELRLTAFVVLKPGAAAAVANIREFCAGTAMARSTDPRCPPSPSPADGARCTDLGRWLGQREDTA